MIGAVGQFVSRCFQLLVCINLYVKDCLPLQAPFSLEQSRDPITFLSRFGKGVDRRLVYFSFSLSCAQDFS